MMIMTKGRLFKLLLVLALSIFAKGSLMALPQEGRVRAPELAGGRGWLNTDKPLSLQALRGKVVLLDFWTYGCINCIHIIPDLKRLEQKYSKELVVIGVQPAPHHLALRDRASGYQRRRF
jgi:thiol-disulfide isomerase/thioredoxin